MNMRFFAAILALTLLTGTVGADDSIVIVLDTSGSMGDYMRSAKKSRMEVAQDALIEVLSKVPDTTKIGILSFEGWIYKLGPVDRAKLEQAIRSTEPGGGTPLYEYIRAGGTQLLDERGKQLNVGAYKLLVVTDGEAGDDRLNDPDRFSDGTPKLGVLDDIMSRNITVDAIGLDMDGDHSLATKINGSYMRGDDAASLVEAVSKAVAEVGFGDDQNAGADAFAEIAEIPDDAVMAVLKGLTTFPNHPVGEKPLVQVVQEDGTVTYQPDPTNEPVVIDEGGGGISFLAVMGIFVGIVAVVIVIIVIVSSSGRRY
jgi:hypothetical protein